MNKENIFRNVRWYGSNLTFSQQEWKSHIKGIDIPDTAGTQRCNTTGKYSKFQKNILVIAASCS